MTTLSFLKNNVANFFSFTKDLATTVTVVKRGEPTYDPSTGSQTITTSSTTAQGLILRFRNSEIDGTLVLRDDKRLLIPYSSITIDDSDQITISGVVHRIMNVRGDILNSYWDLQIRKL